MGHLGYLLPLIVSLMCFPVLFSFLFTIFLKVNCCVLTLSKTHRLLTCCLLPMDNFAAFLDLHFIFFIFLYFLLHQNIFFGGRGHPPNCKISPRFSRLCCSTTSHTLVPFLKTSPLKTIRTSFYRAY